MMSSVGRVSNGVEIQILMFVRWEGIVIEWREEGGMKFPGEVACRFDRG